jgi:hypothetical protein
VNGLEVGRAAGDLTGMAACLFREHIDDASDCARVECLSLLVDERL